MGPQTCPSMLAGSSNKHLVQPAQNLREGAFPPLNGLKGETDQWRTSNLDKISFYLTCEATHTNNFSTSHISTIFPETLEAWIFMSPHAPNLKKLDIAHVCRLMLTYICTPMGLGGALLED